MDSGDLHALAINFIDSIEKSPSWSVFSAFEAKDRMPARAP